jgi:polyisoprenyl-phosphate glycosyltransferase
MVERPVPTAGHPTSDALQTLVTLVPVYNEEEVVPEFHRRLSAVLDGIPLRSSVLYVNDGSSDGTLAALQRLMGIDPRISVIDLSRNFGKEIALTAGLDHADGDAVVVIDADLQDPPELIPELVKGWRQGYDVVYAQRLSREGETWFKRATAYAFYRVIQRTTRVQIPPDTGDFRLLTRRVVASLGELRERNRFMKGLFAWVGFKQLAVPYRRHPRFAGQTKWNYWRLWNFAIEGITSFTTAPLRLATYLGLLVAAGALAYAAVIVYKTLAFGEPVRGYPSLMVVILFLGGVQLMTMGVLGEYLGRTFDESKGRPLYFIQGHYRPRDGQP